MFLLCFSTNFFPLLAGIEGEAKYFDIRQNDVFLMPAGTPHFVLTKSDTIAFGSNFITMSGLARSICRYGAERAACEPEEHSFDNFEVILTLLAHCIKESNTPIQKPGATFRHFFNTMFQYDFQKFERDAQLSKTKV